MNFPGGKIEKIDQRNPFETAFRELNEETNNLFQVLVISKFTFPFLDCIYIVLGLL